MRRHGVIDEALDDDASPLEPKPRPRPGRLGTAILVGLTLLVAVPLAASWRTRDAIVQSGSGGQGPVPLVTSVPVPPRIQLDVPAGWERLLADGDQLVVATRPLGERDLLLARLARADAAFSNFPHDGVAFVVGGDRLQAKYVGGVTMTGEVTSSASAPAPLAAPGSPGTPGSASTPATQAAVSAPLTGPGPEFALGETRSLAGGVKARFGDLPRSPAVLAAYIGAAAPAEAVRQAEAMAASVRYPQVTQAELPPPPPNSRPGFDAGPVDVPDDRLTTAASVRATGRTFTLSVGDGCSVVTVSGSNQRVAGACPKTVAPEGLVVVGLPTGVQFLPPPLPPSQPASTWRPISQTVVMLRAGPTVQKVRAILVDGSKVDAALGAGGWGIAATDGRIFLLEAYDRGGELVAQASAL
jgi:hypothetical protein